MACPRQPRIPGRRACAAALLLAAAAVGAPAAQPMPIMTTVGCVEPADGGGFLLVRATEPEAVRQRLPPEPPADTPFGPRTIRLIGTLDEFGVAGRTGRKVWVKGLLNPAPAGPDRLNLTSITTLSDRCEP